MSNSVVPDIVTVQSMTFLAYQHIPTYTCMPRLDTLPHVLYTKIVK